MIEVGYNMQSRTYRQNASTFSWEREDKGDQPGAAVSARFRVAHHRAVAIIHLPLFAWGCFNDGMSFGRVSATQKAHVPLDALVAMRKSVIIHQVLVDADTIAPTRQCVTDEFVKREAMGLPVASRRFGKSAFGYHYLA